MVGVDEVKTRPIYTLEIWKIHLRPTKGRGSHGPQHEFVVNTRNEDHPITKQKIGCTAKMNFMIPYEDLLKMVLATAYSPKSKEHEPIVMVIDYGKGRVFHTPMGHADYSMKCVGFLTF